MAVPRNVNDVGWYRYGPSPGDAGSAVLAAHVDLASQGPGVFFSLRDLQPGQEVVVDYDDDTSRTFVVQARATYDKDELPLDKVFSREGSPVLTLITCGGGFSPSVQSYDSNVVVYAVPIENVADDPLLDTA
jgi:sortase (surface protein transpeptidase)